MSKFIYLTIFQADYGQGWEDMGEAQTKDKLQMKELYNLYHETKLADRNHSVRYRFIERRTTND